MAHKPEKPWLNVVERGGRRINVYMSSRSGQNLDYSYGITSMFNPPLKLLIQAIAENKIIFSKLPCR